MMSHRQGIGWFLLAAAITWTGAWAHSQQLASQSFRELLALHGIDSSHLERLRDGERMGPADEETIVRILQRWPRFPSHRLEQWIVPVDPLLTALTAVPAESRGVITRVTGRVQQIEAVPLLPELAARLEFHQYYRVTMRIDRHDRTAVICTRTIPRDWPIGRPMDEPAAALGTLLKAEDSAGSRLLFAADRIAWFPDQGGAGSLAPSQAVYLARLGFDFSLFDDVRAENKKPLSLADRDCFYALLAAVRRADQPEFVAECHQPMQIVPLLRVPAEHHGELSTVTGIARRAVRVRVENPEIQGRWGISHYFQIDLFVELDKQVIRMTSPRGADENPVFENAFPVTVCVPSLPAGLREGDSIRENVRIPAVFFKLWSYPSDYMSSFDRQLQQMSPMLIGAEPRVVPATTVSPKLGIGLIVLLVLMLVGIGLGFSRYGRAAGRNRGATSGANPVLPERPDFGNLSS